MYKSIMAPEKSKRIWAKDLNRQLKESQKQRLCSDS
jgi:hypothetical protein